tara:strand:- start:324 stop:1049 length:726 start_codon:yes stop_codon:yes gene_type:complete
MATLTGIIDKMTPKYTTKLPLSKITVKYRPFLVKEEKILLIGMEDSAKDNVKEQYTMIRDLLDSCTDIEDINSLPIAEVELMFLKLRAKSVNNIVKLIVGGEGTDNTTEISLDLDTIGIEGDIPDSKIMVSNDVGITLSPPTLGSLLDMDDTDLNSTAGQFSGMITMIKASMTEIFTQDEIIKTDNLSSDELDEFIQNLSTKVLEKIGEYYNNIPAVQKEVEYELDGKPVKRILKGINDFL